MNSLDLELVELLWKETNRLSFFNHQITLVISCTMNFNPLRLTGKANSLDLAINCSRILEVLAVIEFMVWIARIEFNKAGFEINDGHNYLYTYNLLK
jgi:hypothetical protein